MEDFETNMFIDVPQLGEFLVKLQFKVKHETWTEECHGPRVVSSSEAQKDSFLIVNTEDFTEEELKLIERELETETFLDNLNKEDWILL